MSHTNPGGAYTRDSRYLTTRITADGRDGFPVESGRYRLVVSRACPWAGRAVVVRRLLGLEDALPMAVAGPTHDEHSWTFDLDAGGRDPVLGIERLEQAYLARDPDYDRGITVPAIVDVPTGKVVTNDFPQMTIDMALEWTAYHRPGAPYLYPGELRQEIDSVNEAVYQDVNNGVYRAGFAGSQKAYDTAYQRLFDRLDQLEERLTTSRYLVGDSLTEADVRLFTTLVRLRCRVPRALQVQSAEALRDAGPVGLRTRPVPDARIRRHGRFRSHQAPLPPGPPGHQSDRHRSRRPGPLRLARTPRPCLPGRQALR